MTKRERDDLVMLLATLREMQVASGSPVIFTPVIKYVRSQLFKAFRAENKRKLEALLTVIPLAIHTP